MNTPICRRNQVLAPHKLINRIGGQLDHLHVERRASQASLVGATGPLGATGPFATRPELEGGQPYERRARTRCARADVADRRPRVR